MYRTAMPTATERILADFDTFCQLYIDGTPYSVIAEIYNTSLPTMNITVMPTLRGRHLISSDMEKKRKENQPIYLKKRADNFKKEQAIKHREYMQKVIDTIQKSDLRYKILANYCIFGANALIEKDADSLGLSNLSKNEQQYLADYFRMKYGHYFRYDKLASKIYNLTDCNLFKELMGEYCLNSEQRKGIEFVIDKLPDRQQKIVEYRVFRSFTYDKIADYFGIKAGETIRQQYKAALQRMRHPRWRSYIVHGYQYTINRQEQQEAAKKLRNGMLQNTDIKNISSLPIYSLGLSVRAGNALRRLGWTTVGSIGTLKELKLARGVGQKTVEEITSKLKLLGVELT